MMTLSHARVRFYHEWKIKQFAFREYARLENLRRYNRQRGFIINPYAFGSAAPSTDPYWANVVLLLLGDGADTSTTIIDSSASAHTITVISGAQISTASPPTGMASSIDLAYAGLTIPDHVNFDLVSGDFTVEVTFRENSQIDAFPLLINKKAAINASPFQMLTSSSEDIYTRSSTDGSTYGASINAGPAYSIATFYHLAWCRSGTTFYSWLEGAALGSPVTLSGALDANSDIVTIGRAEAGTNKFNGNISNLRITKGTARYTSAFTPSALPYPTS